jgi:hypothetical protein
VNTNPRLKLFSPAYACALAALAVALVLVPRATPARTPFLTLAPITIANGTATVAGTLGPDVAGATLAVNGQPLGVDTSGTFAGVVGLNGLDSLNFELARPEATTQVRIPLQGLTLIPGSVLDSLMQAGLTVLTPIAGSNDVTVSGSVLDSSQLAALSVNGVDALGLLQRGGSFSVQVPATNRTVSVSMTTTNGTSQTIVQAVTAATATTVSARNAVGLKIASIRYVKKGVLRTHRLRMIVTLKDARGLLVHGGKVRVLAKGRKLAKRPRVALTGPKGRATIVLRLRRLAFGKRLFTVTSASTPSAKARRKSSVPVPRRAH